MRIRTHGPPTHPGERLLDKLFKPLDTRQMRLAYKLWISYPQVKRP